MAATLTGTFKIIDQASGDLKKMAANAALADAAFEKLGARMDVVGSRQKAQGIERTARATRGLGQETERVASRMDRYDRSVRRADRSTGGFGGRVLMVVRGLKDFGGELLKIARPGGMIVGFGTAIGLVGQAVGALAGGIVALGPRLVDLTGLLAPAVAGAAGLATSMLTLRSAFKQLGTAMAGGEAGMKAFREMGKAGQAVVGDLKAMKPLMVELKRAASGGIFAGLHQSLLDVRRVLPSLEPMLRRYSAMLGGELARGTARLTAPGFMGDIRNIMGQGRGVSRDAIRGILNLVSALRHVAVAARPFTEWLSRTVLGWTQFADRAARAGRESGRLAAFFERTKESAEGLGPLHQGPLDHAPQHRARRPPARRGAVPGDAEDGPRLGADHVDPAEPTEADPRLQRYGRRPEGDGEPGGGARGGDLPYGRRRRAGADGDRAPGHGRHPLEKLLTYFADTFGPPMARALVDLTKLLENLGGSAGPLVTILNVVDGIFRGLNAIVELIGPFKGFVATLLGGLLTARLLQKIGLITIAWRGVTVAATQAAGAQVAAMGAGGAGRAGIMLGPLLGGGRGGAAARGRGWLGNFWRGGRAAPGMPGGAAGPAVPGAAATMGRGAMLRGVGGGLARGVGGAASGFILPILGMQAAFGAATTPGGFRERALGGAQGVGLAGDPFVGALSGAGIGAGVGTLIAPGIGTAIGAGVGAGVGAASSLLRPQASGSDVVLGAAQRRVAAGLAAASGARGLHRLNRELRTLGTQLKSISYLNTEAAKKYRASLQDEITARQQLVAQMSEEQRQRGAERGAAVTENLAQMHDRLVKQGVSEPEARRQTTEAGLRAAPHGARGRAAGGRAAPDDRRAPAGGDAGRAAVRPGRRRGRARRPGHRPRGQDLHRGQGRARRHPRRP